MIGYFVFGAFRNVVGIALLTLLVHFSIPLTLALLLVVTIGCCLYIVQVKIFVGDVNTKIILKVFASVFILNRIMLWVFYEELNFEIYIAQAISVVTLLLLSYFFLKSKKA